MVAVFVAVDSFSSSTMLSEVKDDDLRFLSMRSSSSPSESVYVAVNDCNTEIELLDILALNKSTTGNVQYFYTKSTGATIKRPERKSILDKDRKFIKP